MRVCIVKSVCGLDFGIFLWKLLEGTFLKSGFGVSIGYEEITGESWGSTLSVAFSVETPMDDFSIDDRRECGWWNRDS